MSGSAVVGVLDMTEGVGMDMGVGRHEVGAVARRLVGCGSALLLGRHDGGHAALGGEVVAPPAVVAT
eukprot:8347710-Pyramimonas_sp.AAC.3